MTRKVYINVLINIKLLKVFVNCKTFIVQLANFILSEKMVILRFYELIHRADISNSKPELILPQKYVNLRETAGIINSLSNFIISFLSFVYCINL